MSEQNVEVVRAVFRAWGERRPAAALEYIDPDVEVDLTESPSLASEAVLVDRGRDALERVVANWLEAWRSLDFVAGEFIGAGDHVIVPLRVVARGRESGAPTEADVAAVYTVRDGKVVCFRVFDTLDAAKRAAGI